MGSTGGVGGATGVDESVTEALGGYDDVEGDSFGGNDQMAVPNDSAIEGPVEGDRIGAVVVPGNVQSAASSDERDGADAEG
jgi:hypothetical protein